MSPSSLLESEQWFPRCPCFVSTNCLTSACKALGTSPDAVISSHHWAFLTPTKLAAKYFVERGMSPLASRCWHTASLTSESPFLPFFDKTDPCLSFLWWFQGLFLREVLFEFLGQFPSTKTFIVPCVVVVVVVLMFVCSLVRTLSSVWIYTLITVTLSFVSFLSAPL